MLDRWWSDLRSILEEGLDWQSADKLKAIRLLGRHPIESVDDRNVLMVFVERSHACRRRRARKPDLCKSARAECDERTHACHAFW
jgi:hypothetical protein